MKLYAFLTNMNCTSLNKTNVSFPVARHKLDWILWVYKKLGETRGHRRNRGFFFSYRKEKKIINWEQDLLYTTEHYQQLRVEFVCDMSYTVLRGRWCNITVLHQVRRKVIIQKIVFMKN